jgi:integrase/recombinase XerC
MAFRHAWKPEGHFMPQFPKPFFVKSRQVWRVQINGKQINLGREKQRAFQSYHELLSRPEPVAADYVTGILDGYLDWCQKHRSQRTFEWYKSHLESFVSSLEKPQEMTTDDLRPFHVQDWVDQHPTWGSSHRRGAITAVQRAFAWAEKLGHIQKSPIRYIEKPAGGRREQVISSEEFGRILGVTKDQAFRDLLIFAWETGVRPYEIRTIEARHYHRDRQRIEIPPAEAKGKKRWRIIYLTALALSIVQRLVLKHRSGPLFRNTNGDAWHPYAINCRFGRLKKKLGVEYALYAFRHTFANRPLQSDVDSLTVSSLLGHVDGTMLAKVYSHLNQQGEYLQDKLRTASKRTA